MTYKYGSLALSHVSDDLASPHLKWLGLKPEDSRSLDTSKQPLTASEVKKVNSMLDRSYISAEIKKQLKVLLETRTKSEIESLHEFSPTYLAREYIPNMIKLCSVDDD